MESPIKIHSVSIDLANANEKIDEDKCEHFSIRGYVAKVRKRDWKICLSFLSDGDSSKYEDQTCLPPPLHVPEFRFWRCQSCLREIVAKGTEIGHGEGFKPSLNGFASSIVCSHVPVLSDAAKLSDLHQAANQGIRQGNDIDANAAFYPNNITEYHPLSFNGKKEKKAELAGYPVIGNNMESEDINQDNHRLTGNMTNAISSLVQKTHHSDEKVALQPKCNGSNGLSNPACGNSKVSNVEFAENLHCAPNSTAKICDSRKENSLDDQHKELKGCKAPKEFNNVNVALSAEEGNVSGHLAMELDCCDYLSAESAEMIGNKIQDETSSGLHRRKTQKVRLLTELLCGGGHGDNDKARKGNSMPNAMRDSSEDRDKCLSAQETMDTQGKNRSLSLNKKRKLSEDEGLRPLEVDSTHKTRKVRILKRDVETPDAVKGSALKRDECARLDFQNAVKSEWRKRETDRSPLTGKKKRKRAMISYECGPSEPPQNNLPNEVGDKLDASKEEDLTEGGQVKSVDNAFTGSKMDHFPWQAQKRDKGKMPQINDCHVSLYTPNHCMLSEGPITRKDAEALHMGPTSLSYHPVEDVSSDKRLNLSLSSYMDTQRCSKSYTPQVEDSRTSLLTWQESTSEDHPTRKATEASFLGNFSLNEKSTQDISFKKGLNGYRSSEIPTERMILYNDKQNNTSRFDIGGCSIMQHKDVCITRSDKRLARIQEYSEVKRKDTCQLTDSKVSDLDDIPIDIVELMAKNQCERHLPDAKYSNFQLETSNNTGSSRAADFDRVYGHSKGNFFQQDSTQYPDLWAKTGKNGISKGGENVGTNKQKLVDYFAQADRNRFNRNQLEKIHTASGRGAFLLGEGKSLGGLQHTGFSSSKHNNAQICEWLGDVVGKRSSNTSLQTTGPCNTCQNIPLGNKTANHIWSSMMSHHIPFVRNIPEKCAVPTTNLEMLSHPPGSAQDSANRTPDMRFLNQNATNLPKKLGNFGSEIFAQRLPEYPSSCKYNGFELNQKPGSMDLYSNEIIPAMHLLSLMDARLRSNVPTHTDVTSQLLKRPSLTHDHNSKAFPRMHPGANSLIGTMKHQPYYLGKNQHVENSHEYVPGISRLVGHSTSYLRHDKSLEKTPDLSGQAVVKEMKGFDSHAQPALSIRDGSGNNSKSIPVRDMQKMLFGASDSVAFALTFHSLGNSTKQKFESHCAATTLDPHRSSSVTEICSLNRNPADFCIPEGNAYMIASEELKFRKVISRANASSSTKLDVRKRQKKHSALKDHRQHRVS